MSDLGESLSSVPGRIAAVPFVGAFESTYLPVHRRDVAELTGSFAHWGRHLDYMRAAGVGSVRFPIRWHRVEAEPGVFDWSETDRQLQFLRARGMEPIVDLVHHTSYPQWLDDGFRDRRFAPAYLRYAEAVARRYPWLTSYTLFNEPFATLFLCGHEALWPPYDSGIDGFVRLVRNVLPAIAEAARCWSELLPAARHVWVDTCEHHDGTAGGPAEYAALANDRRHMLLDLVLGHDLSEDRPFLREIVTHGGEDLLHLDPVRVDVLGLDYYCHSEWWYEEFRAHTPSPHPLGFAAVAGHYSSRYGLPMLLSETNIRGTASDRASWLRYTLEQYELALSRGTRLEGYCWFPFVDSCDWDSMLARAAGRPDPVGVVGAAAWGSRTATTCFTDSWMAAASGTSSRDLPAYRFQPPCDSQLRGLLPQMSHWPWRDPPEEAIVPPARNADEEDHRMNPSEDPDLVVLSHLRWTWVWQRPQHLVSRFAAARARTGARTWFLEEPMPAKVEQPVLRHQDVDGITRVWLELPAVDGQPAVPGFDAPGAEEYGALFRDLLAAHARPASPDVLIYTPMALEIARTLEPGALCYDVMDDLASFRHAPKAMQTRQRQALAESDVVFAGGASLHRSVSRYVSDSCYLFPSGVDAAHYETSRLLREERAPGGRKVAGYVGVIDERLDLGLLEGLAAMLPDWLFRIVGPVAKIDPAMLPQAPNIEYTGMAEYAELPAVMAEFDVALMPFAMNEATRSISPTKTLEYLAAGLPVVSTPVPDVVAGYRGLVNIQEDAAGFADAVHTVLGDSSAERDRRMRPLQRLLGWDAIAAQMHRLIRQGAAAGELAEEETA